MILEVTRGHIKVKIGEKVATIQGEMFFPEKDKIGFVLYKNSMNFWDAPDQNEPITSKDVDVILADIQADFAKGGHLLEVE